MSVERDSEFRVAGELARALRRTFGGEVLGPDDSGYEESRRVWNAMIDRRPASIARPRSTSDVATILNFARNRDLEISVRGGGHSIAGHSVTEGGLMIDLTRMRNVHFNPATRIARAQGGCLLRDLDVVTAPHNMYVPCGVFADTGIGGLTLGGGEGWLGRMFGLTCDNLIEATVVTASGEVVVANETQYSDLLWGLRGGGGNFGVVTEFTFTAHPIRPEVTEFYCLFAADDGPRVIDGFRALASDLPEEATLVATINPFLREGRLKLLPSIAFAYIGDPANAEPLKRAVRALAPVRFEEERKISFLELQLAGEPQASPGIRHSWKSFYLREFTDDAATAFLSAGGGVSEDERMVGGSIAVRGGAYGRVPPSDTAFAHRDAAFNWIASTAWEDAAEDAAWMDAIRRYARAMAPFASGAYVNSLCNTDDGDAARVGADVYRPYQLSRLRRLKTHYDPANVFHLNHNIPPG